MRRQRISDAIGSIDEKYVEEANSYVAVVKTSRPGWVKWAAMAACLALVIAGFIHFWPHFSPPRNEDYKLIVENGNYYIRLKNTSNFGAVSGGSEFEPEVEFQSLAEMISDIRTGNFTKDEMVQLARIAELCGGDIPVCDLDALWEPVMPSTCMVDDIRWSAMRYSFDIIDPIFESGMIFFISQDSYNSSIDELMNYAEKHSKFERIEIESDRNATAYYYSQKDNDEVIKYVIYTIENADSVYYVEECYVISQSETSLTSIQFYGISQGGYFKAQAFDLLERPSVKWISSFSFKEYEG